MAKKEDKKEVKKPKLFYFNRSKYQMAEAKAKKPSDVKKLYEEMGGVFTEGYGYKEV